MGALIGLCGCNEGRFMVSDPPKKNLSRARIASARPFSNSLNLSKFLGVFFPLHFLYMLTKINLDLFWSHPGRCVNCFVASRICCGSCDSGVRRMHFKPQKPVVT